MNHLVHSTYRKVTYGETAPALSALCVTDHTIYCYGSRTCRSKSLGNVADATVQWRYKW